jgi:hypothetical protein
MEQQAAGVSGERGDRCGVGGRDLVGGEDSDFDVHDLQSFPLSAAAQVLGLGLVGAGGELIRGGETGRDDY